MAMEWVSQIVSLYLGKICEMRACRVMAVFFSFVAGTLDDPFFSFVKTSALSLQAIHGSYLLTTYWLLNKNV